MSAKGEGSGASRRTPSTPRPSADPIERRCTAKAKITGQRCKRTPSPGATVCRVHGGNAPQVKRKALQRQAVAEAERVIARLGGSIEKDPLDALLELVREAAANVHGYRSVVETLEVDVGPGAVASDAIRTEHAVFPERPHILVTMYDAERDRLARYSKLCIDAGIDERRVRLAEFQGRGLADVVKAAVDALAPTDAQRLEAMAAAGAVMRRLGAEAG